jgi:hypothetical protein
LNGQLVESVHGFDERVEMRQAPHVIEVPLLRVKVRVEAPRTLPNGHRRASHAAPCTALHGVASHADPPLSHADPPLLTCTKPPG